MQYKDKKKIQDIAFATRIFFLSSYSFHVYPYLFMRHFMSVPLQKTIGHGIVVELISAFINKKRELF